MKCTYHKQDGAFRVQNRGSEFFLQKHDGSQGTKTNDPWRDIGGAKPSYNEAIAAMYSVQPMTGGR